jgi:crotonobetainyl-CoA:carnitine CoA-transferase CaiB-like acyl-CoA transferase
VIKVEPPGGEQTRRSAAVVPLESKGFQALNRGKRSLVVQLRDARGRAVIHRLMPGIDVVITNYRLGVAERMGIDYEVLRTLRTDLIYWQNTGFGETGPEALRAGSDIIAQAYSGLMVSDAKTNDDGAPDFVSVPLADITTGFAAAMGICAALYHRERTGEGQRIDTSLLRSALFMQGAAVMRQPATDAVLRDPLMEEIRALRFSGGAYGEILEARRRRAALRTSFRLYYGAYRAKDGAVVLGALTKANRDAMRRVLGGDSERSDDPDYNPLDEGNQGLAEEWKARYRALFRTRTVAEWVAAFDAAGAPVAAVNVPEEMADDPQVLADGMIWELDHSVTGPQRVVGPALKMSRTPAAAHRASPGLGEHSREVLVEAGFAPSEVDDLVRAGVVAV